MDTAFTPTARRLGILAGWGTAVFILVYVVALVIGLMTLPSPEAQIADPWFTAMEVLIILMMPVILGLMIAVHAFAAPETRPFALAALVFMSFVAVVTDAVHFTVLTLSRQPVFANADLMLAFKWPSLVYVLDILAWDLFFPLSVLCAVPVFAGTGLPGVIRWLLLASGILALIGLVGIPTANMLVRDIGIVGYVVFFPVATALIARLFSRTGAGAA